MSDLVERAERAHKWAVAEDDHIEPELVAELVAELTRLREQCEAKDTELRKIGAILGTQFMDPPDGGDVPIHEQVRRAKAEIERLKAERDEALMNFTNEQCRKSDDAFDAYNDLASANKQIASLSAEIARLRKALEPFAKHHEFIAREFPDDGDDTICAGLPENPITMGHFRAAFKSLAARVREGEKDGLE